MVLEAPETGDAVGGARLLARVDTALMGGAPAVVVLCAAGAPVLRAREQLRALDRLLAPLAQRRGARVSRSATDGLAAWAASRVAPLGVDVQAAPAGLEPELLRAALAPDEVGWLAAQGPRDVALTATWREAAFAVQARQEAAFAALWAGKEAVLKAFGVGLAWSPREVHAAPVTPDWRWVPVGVLGAAWLSHLQPDAAPSVALAVALNAGQVTAG